MKNRMILIVGLIILVAVSGWWYMNRAPISYDFPLQSGDVVASWNFNGLYKGNAELVARAQHEIQRLRDLIGKEGDDFPDYELFVSIANQYHLMGEGEKEFTYLKYALALDSENTGLAWSNLGVLLEEVGAYRSARIAFEKSIAAQAIPQYRQTYLEFLMKHYPQDAAVAEQKAALKQR